MTSAAAQKAPWTVPSVNEAAKSSAQPMNEVGASLTIALRTSGSGVVAAHRPMCIARTNV